MVFERNAAHKVPNFCVVPLGTVVTYKLYLPVQLLFYPGLASGTKEGLKGYGDRRSAQRLCSEALPSFLAKTTGPRTKYPNERMLQSKAQVANTFPNTLELSPNRSRILIV